MRTFWVTTALVLGSVPVGSHSHRRDSTWGRSCAPTGSWSKAASRTVMPVVGLVGSARFCKTPGDGGRDHAGERQFLSRVGAPETDDADTFAPRRDHRRMQARRRYRPRSHPLFPVAKA